MVSHRSARSVLYTPTKVLVTVLTYPHPSQSYDELVCTAGITEAGEWVRLYPVDYRYRPTQQQFHKYQWIEVGLAAHGAGNDNRKESRRPDLSSIKILGERIGPEHGWRERRTLIDPMPTHTLNELKALHQSEKVSLGIVRPTEILDLKITDENSAWKPEWQAIYDQMRLFGPPPKPLRKLPFKFQYVFRCAGSDKPHRAMIEDWELGVLWLKESERLGDERAAAESVRSKYLDQMCRADNDVRFFMGTKFPYNTWLVLGVFWPPRILQPALF
jgi:hypothetical protein